MAGEDDRGEYELAAGLDKPRPPATSAPSEPKPAPTISYQSKPQEKPFSPETLLNRQAPIALLAGSLLVHFVAAWWTARSTRAFGAIGLELLASTGLMLVCVFIASKARGFKLGSLPDAILKLMAISVAPSAAMMLLSLPLRFIPFGFVADWGIGFCLYFALLGLFFDLDQDDTWLCVLLIFVVQICVHVVMQFAF